MLERARSLGDMGRDDIHQWRRQRIVGFEPELLESLAHRAHLRWVRAGLNDRGHKGCKLRRRPAALRRQLRMDEIQTIEWMLVILDAAVHVNATSLASVALNRGLGIHHRQLVGILSDAQFVARYHSDHRKQRILGLPALSATAD